MLAILAVFVPSFLDGRRVARTVCAAVAGGGFAMLASYLLSNTLVPVLSVWLLREQAHKEAEDSFFHRLQQRYARLMNRAIGLRWPLLAVLCADHGRRASSSSVASSVSTFFRRLNRG